MTHTYCCLEKIIYLLLISFLFTNSVCAQSESSTSQTVKQSDFAFDHQTFNFGTFDKGIVQTHEFKLVNTGNAPLVIKHVATGCGCTKVEYPREPIAPQKEVVLKVTFDGSKLISGHFRKSVTVYTNAPRNYTRLFIRGETK